MELIAIVIGLVVAQYFYLTMKTGMVRGRTGVPAPAMHGNPEFDRQFRVQYNTIEQLVIFFNQNTSGEKLAASHLPVPASR